MNGLSIVILTSLLLLLKYLYVTFRSDNVVYVRIPRDKVMMIFLSILALTNTITWILATI